MDESLKKIPLKRHIYITYYMVMLCVRKFPIQLILIGCINIVSSVIPVGAIWVGKLIIDNTVNLISHYSTHGLHYLILLVILELALVFGQSALAELTSFINLRFSSLFEIIMKEQILDKCEKIPYHKFESPEFYNYFRMMIDDVSIGASSYALAQIDLLQSLVSLASLSYILVITDFRFLIVILALNIIDFIIGAKLSKKTFAQEYDLAEPERKANYFFDMLTQIRYLKDVRLFNLGNHFKKSYINLNKIIIKKRLAMGITQQWVMAIFELLSTLVFYAFYCYILFQVIKKKLTLGDISIYQRAYTTLNTSIASIINNTESIYTKNLTVNLFFKFQQLADETTTEPPPPLKHIDSIHIKNLSFHYPRTQSLALNNISFKLNRGEFTVIVGRNGSGKSTLIKLLSRLYQGTKESILINSLPIESIDRNQLRQHIGILLQDFNKYELSLYDNISLGNIESCNKPEDYLRAIRDANICDLIKSLPQQEQTLLSRLFGEGIEPSIGQWQKIAIARLLFRNPEVMIFDEPSASLDHESTQAFFQHAYNICHQQHKIVVIISHEKELLPIADKIIYMEQGKVIGIGTHQELLTKHNNYYSLWEEALAADHHLIT
jgi:ABC-type multidrug transport system fused ATPase/permease subunit